MAGASVPVQAWWLSQGWHQWRARTPWPNISELPFNAEPIANRRLHLFLALVSLTHVLLAHRKVSYFIFGHPTITFILYFKHMSPAPCLRLMPRWKVKFVIFLVSPSVDGQICNAKVILNGLSQKEIALHQSAPADICCHFNLSPLLISVLIYSCNDVMNGIVGRYFSGWIWQMSAFTVAQSSLIKCACFRDGGTIRGHTSLWCMPKPWDEYKTCFVLHKHWRYWYHSDGSCAED